MKGFRFYTYGDQTGDTVPRQLQIYGRQQDAGLYIWDDLKGWKYQYSVSRERAAAALRHARAHCDVCEITH